MRKRGTNHSMVGVAFVLLLSLVAFFLVRTVTHHPPSVNLPQETQGESGGEIATDTAGDSVRRVEVTPQTVQLVIERLARAENYSRTVTIERSWSDGSATASASVVVADGWTRVDMTDANGGRRHSVTGGDRSWVWYNDNRAVFTGAAAITADEEQSIPTYENILLLETSAISVADYRTLEGVNCIYVETVPDAMGYYERFWISVENGLLAANERLQGETPVYRMTGLSIERDSASAAAFTLPDGTVLFDPNNDTKYSESEG